MTFAGVVLRDQGAPWGDTGMTSEKWLDVPVQSVRIADLIATQAGVLFEHLIQPKEPFGGDLLPHVVEWRGLRYLEDGHHRITRMALEGARTVRARVLQLGEDS